MEGPQQQKQQSFSREDARTMRKELTRLRETEADQERQRIASLKTAKEARQEREKMEAAPEAEDRRRIGDVRRQQQGIPEQGPGRNASPSDAGGPHPKFQEVAEGAAKRPPGDVFGRRDDFPERAGRETRPREAPSAPPPARIGYAEGVAGGPARKASFSDAGGPGLAQMPPEAAQRPPSSFEKLFIRAGIILIIVLVFTNIFLFWRWYIHGESEPLLVGPPVQPEAEEVLPEEEALPPEEEPLIEEEEEEEEIVPEFVIPAPLIAVQASTTLEIASLDDLPKSFFEVLGEGVEGQFTRILIKTTEENELVDLEDFLEAFSIKTPEGFYENIAPGSTFFLYPQKEGKRLGFVFKVLDRPTLSKAILGWESTMEADLENFFLLVGKTAPALVRYFRQTAYKGALIRYQTFSRQDLGICYGFVEKGEDSYFVLTSSWQSLLRTIDRIVD